MYRKFNFIVPVLFAIVMVSASSCSKSDDASPQVTQNDIAAIDGQMNSWMTTYGMPGASIAVSKNGKLVYRKGYGNADNSSGEKVTVDSRFRIASVSKTFTSAAIFKLVDDGLLSLNQKVFGAGSILGTTYGTTPYSTGITDITVDELLHHTGGGWGTNAPGDPAFYDSSMNYSTLIGWTLDNNPLVNTPGTNYRYSNFGYILLARVIEKVSGQAYEDYVKNNILIPIGATHTEIAGNSLALRKSNEVKYYGQGSEDAYVYALNNYSRADGAFGWISTPSDMLRFATAVDSLSTRADILSPASIIKMRTPSIANPGYACGWGVENGEWYWPGSIPGTASFIYRNANGFCIAIVSNSRYTADPNGALNALLPIINSIAVDNTITTWQDIDQF